MLKSHKSLGSVTCDLWLVTCDLWPVTCDLWLVTCDLWLVTFLWREVINRLTWTFMSGQMTTGVFLKRSPTIQKKGAKTCSYWFLFFFNETPISSLVKNDMTLGVWIEKDRRTIGTGDAGVFLIRYPTIQKKGTKTCSYWFQHVTDLTFRSGKFFSEFWPLLYITYLWLTWLSCQVSFLVTCDFLPYIFIPI